MNKPIPTDELEEIEQAIESLKQKGLVVENGGSYELTLRGLEYAKKRNF